MNKEAIESNVGTLLTEYGYCFEVDTRVDIVDFAQNLGFVVGNAELPDDEDGFLAIQPQDSGENKSLRKVIGVNSKRPLDLKRFIIAHEVAHWALHYKDGQVYLHRENKKGKNREENEADYFAAALLMPRTSFKQKYLELEAKGLSKSVICALLASIFKAPVESVSRRIGEV